MIKSKVKIYTSYFAMCNKIPDNIAKVAISRGIPKGISCFEYKKLAPSWELIQLWKERGDWDLYTEVYNREVLSTLNQDDVVMDFLRMPDATEFVLLCYEKLPPCHRFLVSDWLIEAGYDVTELTPQLLNEIGR